jgi:hypothetical protein
MFPTQKPEEPPFIISLSAISYLKKLSCIDRREKSWLQRFLAQFIPWFGRLTNRISEGLEMTNL